MDFITRLENQFDYDRVSSYMLRYWSASLFISAAYVVVIFSIQRWMRDRKPYQLQRWLFAWSTALTGISLTGLYRTGGSTYKGRKWLVNMVKLILLVLFPDPSAGGGHFVLGGQPQTGSGYETSTILILLLCTSLFSQPLPSLPLSCFIPQLQFCSTLASPKAGTQRCAETLAHRLQTVFP